MPDKDASPRCDRVRKARQAAGLSIGQAAGALATHEGRVKYWENSEDLENFPVMPMSAAYLVSVAYLMNGEIMTVQDFIAANWDQPTPLLEIGLAQYIRERIILARKEGHYGQE